MSPVKAVLGQAPGGDRQGEGIPAVMRGPAPGCHDLSSLQFAEGALGEAARVQQFLARKSDWLLCRRRIGEAATRWAAANRRAFPTHTECRLATIELLQVLSDHLQWQVMFPLHREHIPQPFYIALGVAAITRRRALRSDESLGLQKPDLGDRDLGKFSPQDGHDLAYAACRVSQTAFGHLGALIVRASGASFAGRAGRGLGRVRHDARDYSEPRGLPK